MSLPTLNISIDVPSFLAAAKTATSHQADITGLGADVCSVPAPKGAEEIAEAARSVGSGFAGDAALLGGLSNWLTDRAARGAFADLGIFSSAPALVPGQPWKSPVASKRDPNHPGPDTGSGVASALREVATGFRDTSIALQSYQDELMAKLGRAPTDPTEALLAKQRRESTARRDFDAGVEFAYRNPIEFLKLMKDDMSAKDARDKGDYDFAGGKIAANFAGLFFAFTKIGSASATAARAGSVSKTAARVAREANETARQTRQEANRAAGRIGGHSNKLQRQPGEDIDAYNAREAVRLQNKAAARLEWEDRRRDNETAKARAQAAETAASLRSAAAIAKSLRVAQRIGEVPGAARKDVLGIVGAENLHTTAQSVFGEQGDERRKKEGAR